MLNIIRRKKEIKLQGDTIPLCQNSCYKRKKSIKIDKRQNNKCWQVCKEKGTLIHFL